MWKETLKKLLSEKERVILAIDGPCASGKTTFAKKLALEFDGNLIHTDDFFLRPEQRTAERFAEPGGNLDRERFSEEVVLPLKKSELFSYTPFDCKTMAPGETIKFSPKKLWIIEGSYSTHPAFGRYYDLALFLKISSELQMIRLKARSPEKITMFQNCWIPLENKYFEAFSIEQNCDYILNSEKDLLS